VDLFIFDQSSGQPMQSSTGADVANPASFELNASNPTRTTSVDDLLTAQGAFDAGVKLGFGVLVVGGQDPDGVNLQGFVVNSHTSPSDLSVFAFEPQPLQAAVTDDPPTTTLRLAGMEESPGRTREYGGCIDTLIKAVYSAGLMNGSAAGSATIRLDFFHPDGSSMHSSVGPLPAQEFTFDDEHRVLSILLDDLIEAAGGFPGAKLEGFAEVTLAGDWRNVTLASYVVETDSGPNDLRRHDEHLPLSHLILRDGFEQAP
jgi:hypothetical protein